MRVSELIAGLQTLRQDAEVKIWLPGSCIYLTCVMGEQKGVVLIEGNLEAGSALDTTGGK